MHLLLLQQMSVLQLLMLMGRHRAAVAAAVRAFLQRLALIAAVEALTLQQQHLHERCWDCCHCIGCAQAATWRETPAWPLQLRAPLPTHHGDKVRVQPESRDQTHGPLQREQQRHVCAQHGKQILLHRGRCLRCRQAQPACG